MEENKKRLWFLAGTGILIMVIMILYPAFRSQMKKRTGEEISLRQEEAVEALQNADGQYMAEDALRPEQGQVSKGKSGSGQGAEQTCGFAEMEWTVFEEGDLPEVVVSVEDMDQSLEISLWQSRTGFCYFFLPGFARERGLTLADMEGESALIGEKKINRGDVLQDISEDVVYDLALLDENGEIILQAPLIFMYSSDLPVVSLTTASGDMAYIDEDKENEEPGEAELFDRDGERLYAGAAESIRGRGNSTWGISKKPYQFRLKEKTDFFGFGQADSWNLIANGYDETRLRNRIVTELARELGMDYVPDSCMVDLYINDVYYGNYYLTEKIRVDDQGVAIRDMEEITDRVYSSEGRERIAGRQNEDGTRRWAEVDYQEEEISGGYLFERELASRLPEEISGFVTDQGDCYALHSPAYATEEQVNYIAGLMQEFQDALEAEDGRHPVSGKYYSEYIDMTSFVQKYLVEEVSKNYDGGVTSSFFYKPQDSVSSKIFAGPVWDYDVAFGNCNLDEIASNPEGVTKLNNHVYGTDIFARLYEKEDFYSMMISMYREQVLPWMERLLSEGIDRMVMESRDSADMDSIRWEDLENRYQYYEDYDNDVRYLKYFISQRRDFLNKVWLEGENYHSLIFVVDGEPWQIVCVKDGETWEEEPIPFKTSSLFIGWLSEDEVPYDKYKPVYEDKTFYSAWQELPEQSE